LVAQPKRLGFLSCGKHARRSHAISALRLGHKIAAVYDPLPESVAAMLALAGPGTEACKSAGELLARTDLDGIIIASLPSTHTPLLQKTIKAILSQRRDVNPAVLCDKPLAVTPAQIDELTYLLYQAESQNIGVMCCFPRSHQAPDLPYGWAIANLGELTKRFGRLVHVEVAMSYHQIDPSSWKAGEDQSFLLNHWPHEIEFLLRLLGPHQLKAARVYNAPERYMVSGVMGTGKDAVTFTGRGARLLTADHFEETIFFQFAGGTCQVNTKTGKVLCRDQNTGEEPRWGNLVTPMEPPAYDRMFDATMAAFVGVMDGDVPPLSAHQLLTVSNSAVVLAEGRNYSYLPQGMAPVF
jgi:predicted dehydrogenase